MSIDDIDLDALMTRVREAAGSVGEVPAVTDGPAEASRGAAAELGQVLTAQAAWNERMSRSLALIAECLQGLQEAWQDLESRVSSDDRRPPPKAKHGRRRRQGGGRSVRTMRSSGKRG
jgi:hypothetical protein